MICCYTLIMPIEFEHNGDLWRAYWKTGEKLTFERDLEMIEMETENVHQIWDEICMKRLFSTNKEDELALLYSFLTRMGYLQQVKIQAEKGENMSEGYQLELGKGRTYLVKGE